MECYCKSGVDFAKCCQPILKKKRRAKTALELMRSRYSAYCIRDINYLVKTTYPKSRTKTLENDIKAWAESVEFYNLEIIKFSETEVEFKACYRQSGKEFVHHEQSKFIFENGILYYESGKIV